MVKKKQTLSPEEKLAQALVPKEQQPYKLPKGWVWTRVGSVSTFERGITFPSSAKEDKKTPENIICLRTANIQDNLDLNNIFYVNRRYMKNNENKIVRKYDILFSAANSRELVGKSVIIKNLSDEFTFGGFLLNVRSNRSINHFYLYYYLRYLFLLGKFIGNSTQTTNIANISAKSLACYSIPLPSLPEQQRIVSRIESLFAKLDAAREKLQQVLDTQEARRSAILHKAFTGQLTGHKGSEGEWVVDSGEKGSQNPEGTEFVPEGWKATSAKDLFQYVTSGSRGWAKYYANDGALFIRMGNLKHGTIQPDYTDKQYVQLPDKAEGQRSLVQNHDILISITADVGMIGYIEHIEQEAYINQHIALARPVHPEQGKFIAWYLVSDIGFQQLKRKQRGATKVGLGLDDIRNLVLYMPSIEEQNMIVEKIETLLEKEKTIHDITQSALSQINLLKKSILARAFRGQLGTQDPSDPDARELLL